MTPVGHAWRVLAGAVGMGLAGCAVLPDPVAATSSCQLEQLAELPVSMVRNVPLIEVGIDGAPARMVLDTGAGTSVMLAEAVRRRAMRLDPDRAGVAYGVGGARPTRAVLADTLQVDGVTLRHAVFGVGTLAWSLPVPPPDGFLGSDVLGRFDVDLDLPDGRVVLYRARFCPSGTPPWSAPHDVLALSHAEATGLWSVPVTLDGHVLRATIDTGAEASAVSMATAASLGLGAARLARDPALDAVGFGPGPAVSRAHVFGDIAIGQTHYTHPLLIVVDLPNGAGDLLLGADYLRQHRLWLSFATGRMMVPLP